MKLLVGLGNPGDKYCFTRHNIGFMIADRLSSLNRINFSNKKKGLCGTGQISGEDVILLKPQTFMNLSGESVQPVCSYYNISPENIIVLHDEIDLEFSRIKIKEGGGHGGHNGLRSIVTHIGSNNFTRIRIGVGRPTSGQDVSGYVLQPFSQEEQAELDDLVEKVTNAVDAILKGGTLKAMNKFN